MLTMVLGMGVSGISASFLSLSKGNHVIGVDRKEISQLGKEAQDLIKKGVEIISEEEAVKRVKEVDLLIVSPGVRKDNDVIKSAKDCGKKVISEIEFAFDNTKGKIVAVTGSNGKTTTTSLIYSIMKRKFKDVRVGGNIGTAFSSIVSETDDNTIFILEISSFQLEDIDRFSPNVAILLNLTPDHQDRYSSEEEYFKTKFRIFENQKENDFAILNLDDLRIMKESENIKSCKFFYSLKNQVPIGTFYKEEKVYLKDKNGNIYYLFSPKELKIKGPHNIENAMASSIASFLFGVEIEALRESLMEFESLPHRLELVGDLNGVLFYNDSKATNVDSVKKALLSFDGNVIILLGGKDKGADFTLLEEEIIKKCKMVVAFGSAKEKIRKTFEGKIEVNCFDTLFDASMFVRKNAKEGEIVLLSPACASFDEFNNFEERGNMFKEWILKGKG